MGSPEVKKRDRIPWSGPGEALVASSNWPPAEGILSAQLQGLVAQVDVVDWPPKLQLKHKLRFI